MPSTYLATRTTFSDGWDGTTVDVRSNTEEVVGGVIGLCCFCGIICCICSCFCKNSGKVEIVDDDHEEVVKEVVEETVVVEKTVIEEDHPLPIL